jgi:predicted MPP superfamily phosphohydrolase
MLPIVVLSTLLHAFMAWRLLPALAAFPPVQALLGVLLLGSALLMPLGVFGRRLRQRGAADALAWAGLLSLGLFSSLLVLTLARDALLLAAAAVAWFGGLVLDAGALAQWSAVGVFLLGATASLWGFANARRTAAVVHVDVPIDALPAALHGFTIAQISDVHVGPTIRGPYLRAIVDAVNRLGADMVAVTGDLVDGSVGELALHVEPLAGLQSTHGTFFVTGNHEYYSGAAAWVVELRRLGLTVLQNEHVVLRHAQAEIVIAGVTDFGAGHFDAAQRSDPHAAIAGAPADTVRVLLAHQPRSAVQAQQAGFQLQLSGHTHGGQFLPWNFLVRLQQPFTAGLHRLHDLWVYTSRGTGYWGPPKRVGAPSEITRLRLVPGGG